MYKPIIPSWNLQGTSASTQGNRQEQVLWLEGYVKALLLSESANKEQLVLLKEKVDELTGNMYHEQESSGTASNKQVEGNRNKSKEKDKENKTFYQSIDEAPDNLPF